MPPRTLISDFTRCGKPKHGDTRKMDKAADTRLNRCTQEALGPIHVGSLEGLAVWNRGDLRSGMDDYRTASDGPLERGRISEITLNHLDSKLDQLLSLGRITRKPANPRLPLGHEPPRHVTTDKTRHSGDQNVLVRELHDLRSVSVVSSPLSVTSFQFRIGLAKRLIFLARLLTLLSEF